jgi:hypothetical protein
MGTILNNGNVDITLSDGETGFGGSFGTKNYSGPDATLGLSASPL